MYMISAKLNIHITLSSRVVRIVGLIYGRVILKNFAIFPAPSISADSYKVKWY